MYIYEYIMWILEYWPMYPYRYFFIGVSIGSKKPVLFGL